MLWGKLKSATLAGLLITGLGLGPAAAGATSNATTPGDDEWAFTFAPYFWMAGLKGDVAVLGLPEVEVDASFSDIMENFKFGLMGIGEVQYGRFGLFTDFLYLSLDTGRSSTPGPLFSSAKVETELLFFSPMLEYRVLDDPAATLDAMAGIRVWNSDTTLNLSGGLLDGRKRQDDETWVDPTIGMKGRFEIAEDWSLSAWGIIGGFGASSDFMWDVFGGVGYQVNDWFALHGGYRGVGVDYDHGDFLLDVVMHGPMLGASFRF